MKYLRHKYTFIGLLFLCSFIFILRNTHFQLASDDISWFRGEYPSVFDQYRLIPRFFFVSLNALFGLNPVAAFVMVVFFHFINAWLVFRLTRKLFNHPSASMVAFGVFLINPITLNALTWFSCFSYVLGTTFALVSLNAAWEAVSNNRGKALRYWIIALLFYFTGLFCSHEIFFLPVVMLLFVWYQDKAIHKRDLAIFAMTMIIALLIHFLIYRFNRDGVQQTRLFSFDFIAAFFSSVPSFGISLGLAYPLSFFFKITQFLKVCFSEPVRWLIALGLFSTIIMFCRPNTVWRMMWVLTVSCAVLFAPYIIRLYLTPEHHHYHLSYVLSGRVFYLPFGIIALVWGRLADGLWETISRKIKFVWIPTLLAMGGYCHALLFLYDKDDFTRLHIQTENAVPLPTSWNPFRHNGSPRSIIFLIILLIVIIVQLYIRKKADR